jgi:Protein of unknown function (DUF707)
VVVVPGLGDAARLPQLKATLLALQQSAVSSIDFTCIVYVWKEDFLENVIQELDFCAVEFSKGLWTHHMKKVGQSNFSAAALQSATHVAILIDDIDAGNVDLPALLRTMRLANFDVTGPSLPGRYSVHEMRSHCQAHKTGFVEILFTIFTKETWTCWQDNLNLEINDHGWGYDLALADMCNANLGIIDHETAFHRAPPSDAGVSTYDTGKAADQMNAWIMVARGYTMAQAVAYGNFVARERHLTFPYCHRIQFHWRNESVVAEPRHGTAEWHSVLLWLKSAGYLSQETPSSKSNNYVEFVGSIDDWFGSTAGSAMITDPWVGFVRLPLVKSLPGFLSAVHGNSSDLVLDAILESDAFLQSVPRCVALFAFSMTLATAVSETLNEMGIKKVAVCNVHHPVAMVEPSLLFDPVTDLKLALSETASVVLLNKPYARVASLHKLQTRRQKIWLHCGSDIGSTDVELLKNRSIAELHLSAMHIDRNVQLKVATKGELNLMVRRNIVIVDTWATAAVPSALESLTFQTPFLIRKMPETIEYMGEDYPLFFTTLQSIQNLLDDEAMLRQKMMEAHTYLQLLDSTHLYSVDSMAREMTNCTLGGMAHWPQPGSQ